MVLLETLLRKVNPKLLTFPFHLKTGTYVFAPYPSTDLSEAYRCTSGSAEQVPITKRASSPTTPCGTDRDPNHMGSDHRRAPLSPLFPLWRGVGMYSTVGWRLTGWG